MSELEKLEGQLRLAQAALWVLEFGLFVARIGAISIIGTYAAYAVQKWLGLSDLKTILIGASVVCLYILDFAKTREKTNR